MKTCIKVMALGVLCVVVFANESRAACPACQAASTSSSQDLGVSFHFNLGSTQYGESAGRLMLSIASPTNLLFMPDALQFDGGSAPGVTVVTTTDTQTNLVPTYIVTNVLTITTNVSGGVTNYVPTWVFVTNTVYQSLYFVNSNVIRQVQAPQTIADIPLPNSTNGYVINFYYPSQVSGQVSGIDSFSGTPYATWLITNTSPSSCNQVQISKYTPADGLLKQWTYSYSATNNAWSRTSLGGVVQKSSGIVAISSIQYVVTNTVQPSGGQVVQQTVTTNQFYNWWGVGSMVVACPMAVPIAVAAGPSSAPELTLYTYYETAPFTNMAVVPVQSITYPDGSWKYFASYDENGNPLNVYTSFGDAQLSSPGSGLRTIYHYGSDVVSGSGDDGTIAPNTARSTTVEDPSGNILSLGYTAFPSAGIRLDIQCTNTIAGWNDAGNLITTNLFYTNGANSNMLQAVISPDQTMTTYEYVTNAANTYRTNIVVTGRPDPTFAYVINGRSNYTVLDQFGNKQVEVSIDFPSNIVLAQDTYGSFDSYGRPQSVTHLDGTTELMTYSCCGLATTTDRDGVYTQFLYDAAKRQTGFIRNGITYTNILDAAGRVLQSVRIGTDSSQIVQKQTSYDLAGEILFETNALGGVTTHTRTLDSSSGGVVRTVINPDGGTITNRFYVDSSLKSLSGTAARPMTNVLGTGSGYRTITTYKLTSTGGNNEWSELFTDMLGRPYQTVYAAASGTPTSYTFYNSLGQRTNDIDPDGVSTLYTYDAKGEQTITMIDMSAPGGFNLSSSNRVTMATNYVTSDHGYNVRRSDIYVWSMTGSATPTLVASSEQSTDGLRAWIALYNNGASNVSANVTAYASGGYRYQTNFAADGSFMASTYQYGLLLSVVRKDSSSSQIAGTSYGYDAHQRQYEMTDARTGTTTYAFNNADQVTSATTPSPTEVTTYHFDNMGRSIQTDLPDGTSSYRQYYPSGDILLSYGSRTYPVGYGYDAQGRVTSMTNWANFAAGTGSRVTSWTYDAYRGFLSGKAYDDGRTAGPNYAYSAAGRLTNRAWARGINTSYTYDNAGSLATVSYSDGTTLGLVYGYDRRGRQIQVVQGGTATTSYTYNDQNQVLTESYSGGSLSGISVTNGYDSLLRRTNLVTLNASGVLTLANYGYDAVSRLETVSDGTNSATYTYLANSPLVSQILFQQNGSNRMSTTKTYDNLNRLTYIGSANASGTVLDSHGYAYNTANQRTSVTNADGTYWVYGYDALGQVISGVKHWPDGTLVAGQQFGYTFDNIGNRTETTDGGDQWGANLRYTSYSANNLNQYTARTVPGAVDIIGSATNTATVTVNDLPTYRRSNYFRAQLPINNNIGPVWESVTNLAVLNVGTNFIVDTNITGNVFLAQTPEAFGHDADGNLTNDGRWQYTWDAENRLIAMTNHPNVPAGAQMGLAFAYDSKGRRVSKSAMTNGITRTLNFVYNNWNLISTVNSGSLVQAYVWGLDFSGSLQQTGGAGGLLFETQLGSNSAFLGYDGNGNVSALTDAASDALASQYEYGAFGEVIRTTGSMTKVNPFRFSTKIRDEETDLIYYGYRYYAASEGRWQNRDPINDTGFRLGTGDKEKLVLDEEKNLYGFLDDDPLNDYDINGLQSAAGAGAGGALTGIAATLAGVPAGAIVTGTIVIAGVTYLTWEAFQCKYRCRRCTPPVGTLMYEIAPANSRKRGRHVGIDHVKYWKMNQNPLRDISNVATACACYWNYDHTDDNTLIPEPNAIPGGPPNPAGGATLGGGVEQY